MTPAEALGALAAWLGEADLLDEGIDECARGMDVLMTVVEREAALAQAVRNVLPLLDHVAGQGDTAEAEGAWDAAVALREALAGTGYAVGAARSYPRGYDDADALGEGEQ